MWSARSATRSGPAASRRSWSTPRASTASSRPTSRCRAAALQPRARGARPRRPRRPRGVDPAAARDLRGRARARRRHRPRPRRPGHPPQGAGRPGRPLRPRRPRAAGLQRGDERRPRPGRRRARRSRSPSRRRRTHGGLPHPTILAACALLGIDEVYAVGGAQAIAMFAYGAGPCRQVDLVTGPGTIYVVAAKRLLKGVVGIDSEAGPTEIAILADDTADAGVRRRRPDQPGRARPAGRLRAGHRLRAARRRRRGRAGQAGRRDPAHRARPAGARPARSPAIVLVDDLEQGLDVVNAYAAEHLEIQTARRRALAPPGSRNAGAIFVGPCAPVSLGDYCAGSNHVLPTAGCACHSSGLSVRAFLQVGARRRLLARRAWPRWPATSSRWPRPRTCPVTAPRSASGSSGERGVRAGVACRSARGAARHRAVRRPAARRAGPAQRQREPLRALAGGGRRHRGVGGGRRPRR